jgi:hypothetical protein
MRSVHDDHFLKMVISRRELLGMYVYMKMREKDPSKKDNKDERDKNAKTANESGGGPEGDERKTPNPSRKVPDFKSKPFRLYYLDVN